MYIAKVTKFIYMFTGIIETLGRVEKIEKDRENINFTIQTNITDELKIDQSVAHNGVCSNSCGNFWQKLCSYSHKGNLR